MINTSLLEVILENTYKSKRILSHSCKPLVVGGGLFYRVFSAGFSGYIWLIEKDQIPAKLKPALKGEITEIPNMSIFKDKLLYMFCEKEGQILFENLYPEVLEKMAQRNKDRFSLTAMEMEGLINQMIQKEHLQEVPATEDINYDCIRVVSFK